MKIFIALCIAGAFFLGVQTGKYVYTRKLTLGKMLELSEEYRRAKAASQELHGDVNSEEEYYD